MCEALDHPQPPTTSKIDNSTADSFFYDTLKKKRNKSWDVRYYWLIDKSDLDNFLIYWDKRINNWIDYHTKHRYTTYHREKRSNYILKGFHVNHYYTHDLKSL